MNRIWYRVLWFVEITLVLIAIAVATLPIRDYGIREFREWQLHPSPESMTAYQEKLKEESRLRRSTATSLVVAGVLLTIPIVKFRTKSSEPK